MNVRTPVDIALPRYRSHKQVWALKIAAVAPVKLPKFERATCKGSYALGSACGHCERCEWERASGPFGPRWRPFSGTELIPADAKYGPILVDAAYMTKHQPQPGGYYVVYADGYESFSPAAAFEEGYTRSDVPETAPAQPPDGGGRKQPIMTDPCSLVNAGIYARLSSATVGFNPTYAAGQSSYTDAGGNPVDPIVIDWTADSANFAYGLVPPDLIEESSAFTYPLLTIASDRAQSFQAQRRVHFQRFSGLVVATIQVHVSWMETSIRDFETWPNAVIGAMLATMNAPSLSAPTVPNSWGTGVVYGYDLSPVKGPILMAGQNWRRTITFTGSFEVLIP